MRRAHRRCLLAFAVLTASLAAQGPPRRFEETYALAADRAKVVATLIPGTEDFYYYSCRERLDARDFAAVRKILPVWIQRHGRSARVIEIENREALLSFADRRRRGPTSSCASASGSTSTHQRVVPGAKSDLPTRLDPDLLSNETLTRRALAAHTEAPSTASTDRALRRARADRHSTRTSCTACSAAWRAPDVDNLPALIVRDLDHPQSGGFGSLRVHALLRRAQLEECLRLRPALLQEPRLRGGVPRAPAAGRRHRVAATTRPSARRSSRGSGSSRSGSPPAFNSLKAHVLFHWLAHDLTQGAPDKDRFLAYIRLPRRGGHRPTSTCRRHQRAEELGRRRGASTRRVCRRSATTRRSSAPASRRFFATEDGYAPYAEFLARGLAQGRARRDEDPPRPGRPGALVLAARRSGASSIGSKRRVDIEFARTSRTRYAADEPVRLDVSIKNVPTLLVKVFAIDGYRYPRREGDARSTRSIDLDGVVPNFEQTFTYAEPPLRRVLRSFDLPMLREPGTYVVEFVGNGLSSRAVVHKGDLRVRRAHHGGRPRLPRLRRGRRPPEGRLDLVRRPRVRAPTRDGEILLPFSTAPGVKQIVLHEGNRSTLATFDHRAESYRSYAPRARRPRVARRRAARPGS